jgi:hypothetical protein
VCCVRWQTADGGDKAEDPGPKGGRRTRSRGWRGRPPAFAASCVVCGGGGWASGDWGKGPPNGTARFSTPPAAPVCVLCACVVAADGGAGQVACCIRLSGASSGCGGGGISKCRQVGRQQGGGSEMMDEIVRRCGVSSEIATRRIASSLRAGCSVGGARRIKSPIARFQGLEVNFCARSHRGGC